MSEETSGNNENLNQTRKNGERDSMRIIYREFMLFIRQLTNMRDEIVEEQTIKTIRDNMVFRGSAVWILVCSIIVASVGLNANSVAVIIGAMLISPLMGPIRAIGLALAINDIPTLKLGLKNFGIMVFVSVITSTLYFLITPLSGDTNELLGRVKPHALDILIAFFGGLAGIIASASSNRNAAMTIVPGVAIATALMPPLCTVSYGIATGQWNYSLGAFYLFLLNAVFICLSTIVVLRLLKFKSVKMVSREREKRVQKYIAFGLVIIIVPSIYMTYTIVKESIFERNANRFINEVIKSDHSVLVNAELDLTGPNYAIKIYTLGTEITEEKEDYWNETKANYKLGEADIKVFRYKNTFNTELLTNESIIAYQEKKIKEMEEELIEIYGRLGDNTDLNIDQLNNRIKVHYPGVEAYSFAKSFESNFGNQIDTVYTFTVHWFDSISEMTIGNDMKTLRVMLETELKLVDSLSVRYPVRVIRY
jgi:uncharacterized hydrophobic protein (TIGR00271 family)